MIKIVFVGKQKTSDICLLVESRKELTFSKFLFISKKCFYDFERDLACCSTFPGWNPSSWSVVSSWKSLGASLEFALTDPRYPPPRWWNFQALPPLPAEKRPCHDPHQFRPLSGVNVTFGSKPSSALTLNFRNVWTWGNACPLELMLLSRF